MSREEPSEVGCFHSVSVPCVHADKTMSNSDNSNTTSDCQKAQPKPLQPDLEMIIINKKSFIDPLWTGRCLWYCLDLSNSLRTM